MSEEEPRIIIDEGWKARVEREREEALQQAKEGSATSGAAETDKEEDATLFEHLLSGLVTQVMMALGLMAVEGQNQAQVDIGLAKHLIDTLVMLREKTKGNLNPLEERSLVASIAELQRAYVARAQQAQEAALKNAGSDPNEPAPG